VIGWQVGCEPIKGKVLADSDLLTRESSSSSYICSKRQHTAIEKQVSRTDRHKVNLHLP